MAKRKIRVRAIHRDEPDIDKLAFALLRLSEQLTSRDKNQAVNATPGTAKLEGPR
jgi:hypothetical protein